MKSLLIASLASLFLFIQSPPAPGKGGEISRPAYQVSNVSVIKDSFNLETPEHSVIAPYGYYSNSYAPLNCTWGVASRVNIPNDWGNANNWAYSASKEGYPLTNVPTVGAIAQTGGDSYLGHVALVIEVYGDGTFKVWEENYAGLGVTDERITSTAEFATFIIV